MPLRDQQIKVLIIGGNMLEVGFREPFFLFFFALIVKSPDLSKHPLQFFQNSV